MEKIKVLFMLITALFMAQPVYGDVSQQDALTKAKSLFTNQDADYFLLKDYKTGVWAFFVDPSPLEGWEHECFVVEVSKTSSSVTPVKTKYMVPPQGNYVSLEVKNRYGSLSNSKPIVSKSNNTNNNSEVSSRTYAIILSGGIRPISNYERYWNDCSFLYQTLVNKYNVPKANIYAVMSDGTDPANDMLKIDGTLVSQPLDLDGDGSNDIKYAATKANVQSILNTLKNKLNKDDHLLFFVIDHGGTDDSNKKSYICLWNNERLYDNELATMLDPICNKYVNVNVVLGQCFAGGFNDDLTKVGCVVSSACKGNESSYSMSNYPYDEFVYHWTSAINGANHIGASRNADSDRNGHVTMAEAFKFAKSMDKRNETPQYISTPVSVGDDLAFTHLAPSVDLYIMDNNDDTGIEPNRTTNNFWSSPAVWCRNNADNGLEHENPYYSVNHTSAKIYVKIKNRGKETSPVNTFFIHAYWTHASMVMDDKSWKGLVYDGEYVTGDHIRALKIPSIPSQGEVICELDWALPGDYFNSINNNNENHHFCLWARIMESPFDDGYVEGQRYFLVGESNKQAQKNVSIITPNDMNRVTSVYMANISSSQQAFSVEMVPVSSADEDLILNSKMDITLSPNLLTYWVNGGSKSQGVTAVPGNSGTFRLTSSNNQLQNIKLPANSKEKISFKITPDPNKTIKLRRYEFDLIQKNSKGEVLGGERFIIDPAAISSKTLEVVVTAEENGKFYLETDTTGLKFVNWQNQVGTILSDATEVIVKPTVDNGIYTVFGINEDNELEVGSINLLKANGIKSISPESNVGQYLDVTLHENVSNSKITISSIQGGNMIICRNIESNEISITIDTSFLNPGLYILNYLIDDEIVDTRKFIKE